ncbi:hypothetical protein NSQ96_17370 [Caldifermentibacillus hisashii]|uniref:hypothetical protein n=1 Tax=Caldifermentibacillus hisashii TaxID=996558 RepID=UPI0031FE1556
MTGKSFFVYAQKFSAGLCIFPLQSSALLFCHTHFTRNSDVKLGFAPAFYSGFMYDVIKNNGKYLAKIEQVNTNAKPQLKVKIIVTGQSTINEDKDSEFDVIEQLAFI